MIVRPQRKRMQSCRFLEERRCQTLRQPVAIQMEWRAAALLVHLRHVKTLNRTEDTHRVIACGLQSVLKFTLDEIDTFRSAERIQRAFQQFRMIGRTHVVVDLGRCAEHTRLATQYTREPPTSDGGQNVGFRRIHCSILMFGIALVPRMTCLLRQTASRISMRIDWRLPAVGREIHHRAVLIMLGRLMQADSRCDLTALVPSISQGIEVRLAPLQTTCSVIGIHVSRQLSAGAARLYARFMKRKACAHRLIDAKGYRRFLQIAEN